MQYQNKQYTMRSMSQMNHFTCNFAIIYDLKNLRFVLDEDTLHDPLPNYFINSSHNTYATGKQNVF